MRWVQTERDEITLDTDGFALEREGNGATRKKIELDVIDRFEAQRRITLIDKSGGSTLLPLSLAPDNEALADRLNAATTKLRVTGRRRR